MARSFLVQIVYHFLRFVVVFVVNRQPQLALFRPQHHRLPLHAAHHVKGQTRLAPQRHLKEVLLDALFDRLFKLALDLEVPVCGTQAADPLMRPFVVVILHPLPYPLGCILEALELSSNEKLKVDCLPEPLDLAQRHRMVRP
jgi:hypothetical protein